VGTKKMLTQKLCAMAKEIIIPSNQKILTPVVRTQPIKKKPPTKDYKNLPFLNTGETKQSHSQLE
jgi:hypothetical protein